ncbi:MAG: hypothetical protein NPIRA05_19280 [Nitrospirales bacterium]|nr:MAG: hypothetical protein NPIRA05_19280 [Nitrospirales bacterium]
MEGSEKIISQSETNPVDKARSQWLAASQNVSHLGAELFQPGSGYGDPEERRNDEYRLQFAKDEAERLFREYHALDRSYIEDEMLKLQRSQRLATWASFAVAAVVGLATIVSIITDLLT